MEGKWIVLIRGRDAMRNDFVKAPINSDSVISYIQVYTQSNGTQLGKIFGQLYRSGRKRGGGARGGREAILRSKCAQTNFLRGGKNRHGYALPNLTRQVCALQLAGTPSLLALRDFSSPFPFATIALPTFPSPRLIYLHTLAPCRRPLPCRRLGVHSISPPMSAC